MLFRLSAYKIFKNYFTDGDAGNRFLINHKSICRERLFLVKKLVISKLVVWLAVV
ncbi:hypothetical protein AHMF7616_03868 [Adhaeribacter pallidiroseus]|uniref:Uncharacterized protein n=1 Tax=Adhaeribacter pallidiroseus TaxID=2072847 RepID=A0A369QSU2_9BACT|nr:hypothetical protein AHMF7616_03868 [Adhaeribacter pallidiroseus]